MIAKYALRTLLLAVVLVSTASGQDSTPLIRGRLLLPDGRPAIGAKVEVRGLQANSARVIEHGLPDDWTNPSTTTDQQGRFSFAFDPPPAFQFSMTAELPGWASVNWRWSELAKGAPLDVGDAEFEPAGALRVRVTDAAGDDLAGGWEVHASAARPNEPGRDATRAWGRPDPATRGCLLEGLPAGPTEVSARSGLAGWIHSPPVTVIAGETTDVTLVYAGPDIASRITVTVWVDEFYVFQPAANSIRLRGAGGIDRGATFQEGTAQTYLFDAVESGEYSLHVEDPRFEPWSRGGIRPGEVVKVFLRGSASITLAVLEPTADGAERRSIDAYELRLRYAGASFGPSEFQLLALGDAPPVGARFGGLVVPTRPPSPEEWIGMISEDSEPTFDLVRFTTADSIQLVIRKPGHAPTIVPVEDLKPNEHRVIEVVLARASSIVGKVTSAPGLPPPARAEVFWYLTGDQDDFEEGDFRDAVLENDSFDLAYLKTTRLVCNPDGGFRIEGIGGAELLMVARWGPCLSEFKTVTPSSSEETVVEFELGEYGALVGRVPALEGRPFSGLRIAVAPEGKLNPHGGQGDADDGRAIYVEPDDLGSFRAEPLPVGGVDVFLQLARNSGPNGSSSSRSALRRIGRAKIRRGDATAVFDAGEFLPVQRRIRVLMNGTPLTGVDLQLVGSGMDTLVPDGDGLVETEPIFPGTYGVSLREHEGRWSFFPKSKLVVGSDSIGECTLELPLIVAALIVLDAETGVPLADATLEWESSDEVAGHARGQVRTDSTGRAQITSPPGRMLLKRTGGIGAARAKPGELQWTHAGPVPAEVRLLPAER